MLAWPSPESMSRTPMGRSSPGARIFNHLRRPPVLIVGARKPAAD